MKTSTLSTLVMLSLSAALGPVHLMAQGPINVTIPFNFSVGSNSFAAGAYSVRQIQPSVLMIESVDGRGKALTTTHTAEPNYTQGTAVLNFNRYGDRYFLSRVSNTDRGWELIKPATERELIAKRAESSSVSVVAGVK